MKKILLSLFVFLMVFVITGCNKKISKIDHKKSIKQESENMSNINVIIDNQNYILHLEDNETVKEFIKLLPNEFEMNELNGNEKYVYLEYTLPTNSYNPKHINAGDVMLYGSDCLVIFYKSFDTSYHYTKIGHIDHLPNLENDHIVVKFVK